MTDPYQTLQVSPDASDEEVKKAYRELARKYHPDNYHDSPLEDLAQEKMPEINAAYEAVQKQRSGQDSSGGRTAYGYRQADYGWTGGRDDYGAYSEYTGEGAALFRRVRLLISQGDLTAAEQLLSSAEEHNGEWNYLKGVICCRREWLDEARQYFRQACRLDPENMEYRDALARLENGRMGYRPQGYEVYTSGCGAENPCGRMVCAYLMCNACGGFGYRFFCC